MASDYVTVSVEVALNGLMHNVNDIMVLISKDGCNRSKTHRQYLCGCSYVRFKIRLR